MNSTQDADPNQDVDPSQLTDSRSPQLIGVTAAFLAMAWIAVLLRCFVRIRITKSFKADDWLMVASVLIFTVFSSFVLVSVHYGLGQHDETLTQDQEIAGSKYLSLAALVYIANSAFIKASIALFLLRIAVKRPYQIILKVSMVLISLWAVGLFFFNLFECQPVARRWDWTIEGGGCLSGDSFINAGYALSVLSVLSDWLYALLPIPMLWNVQMNRNTKIVVVVILSLGIFASIATLIRIKYIISIDVVNPLYASTDTIIWSLIEPGLAIVAASIATLRPLLRALNIRGFSADNSSPFDNSDRETYARGGLPSSDPENQTSSAAHALRSARSKMALGHGRGPFSVLTTTTITSTIGRGGEEGDNKKTPSVSMKMYHSSYNDSQEIILAPLGSPREVSTEGQRSSHDVSRDGEEVLYQGDKEYGR